MSTQTIRDRMAQGIIPVSDALRYAMILGETLRKMHDSGQVHGGVTPSCLAITASGMEVLPPQDPAGAVTPYTAPEVAAGHAPDSRSDIFSFGAVLYEMLTGRRAFEGDNAGAWAWAIAHSSPTPSGSAAVDRLTGLCLVKDPAARCQRMQKVMLELKLLSAAARRADSAAPKREAQLETVLRAEMKELEGRLESRLDARLETQAQAISEIQRSAHEALESLRAQLGVVGAQIAAAQQRAVLSEQTAEAAGQRILAHVEENFAATAQRIGSVEQRIGGTEEAVAAARQQTSSLQDTLGAELKILEQAIKGQSVSIESARTAMAQTDDLVERVVEALESLQSTVLEQSDDRGVPVN
jgi:ElaB/YqjD/DUF883 family membrane-anchored ribosome-binding protein